MTIAFDNSYARLPERFYALTPPSPVARPRLLRLNEALAKELGLDAGWLASPEGVEMLAGNRVPPGSTPIATAYAGHQFGNFVPQLGDGRAILLGEVIDRQGRRRDIVLKGAGRTRFSRGGDGRAAIGPVLREYIVSEAMHALGIPTTRALAAVATGEEVLRETALPGAVFTRVAASHIRVGTFQFFAARRDREGVEALADHVIERHYPEAKDAVLPALDLLGLVCERQARLVAQWLLVGFIHGVMNTDNMAISGETIDYGPCAFLDAYDPETVLSSIDLHGRYAYGNQPSIALWDLTRFAETLLPLLDEDKDRSVALAEEALQRFAPAFDRAYGEGLRRKLGLPVEGSGEADEALVRGFLDLLARHRVDFTLGFRRLGSAPGSVGWEALRGWMELDPAFDEWAAAWRARLGLGESEAPALDGINPIYIPRNHLVEQALAAAVQDDLEPFEDLVAVLADPFSERPGLKRYALPARDEERVLRTFCGT